MMGAGEDITQPAERFQDLLIDYFWRFEACPTPTGVELCIKEGPIGRILAATMQYAPAQSDVGYAREPIRAANFGAFCADLAATLQLKERDSESISLIHDACAYVGRIRRHSTAAILKQAAYDAVNKENDWVPERAALERMAETELAKLEQNILALCKSKQPGECVQITGLFQLARFRVRSGDVFVPAFTCGDIYATNNGSAFRHELSQYAEVYACRDLAQ